MHKVKVISLVIYSLFIALFRIYYLPQSVFQIIKILLLIFVGFYLIPKVRFRIINSVSLFCLSIVISSVVAYFDGLLSIRNVLNSILYCVCLFLIYLTCFYCKEKKQLDILLKDLFNITTFYCLLSFISMAVEGHSSESNIFLITYIFGSKFTTSYLFLLWISLFRINYQNKIDKYFRYKLLYIIFTTLCILTCAWLYCTTATVAAIFLFAESIFPEKWKNFLFNKTAALIFVIIAGLVPFYINQILNSQKVQHIIIDIFHKSLNLTGRKVIYENLLSLIIQRPFWGFGYGNNASTHIISTIYNVQNGLCQLLVDYGLIGTVFFLVLIFNLLSRSKSAMRTKTNGMYALMYAFIICSTVEISYNFIFFLTIFIIGAYDSKSKMFDVSYKNKSKGRYMKFQDTMYE